MGLVTLLVAIVAEGSLRIAVLEGAASQTTPYARFIGSVDAHIPGPARVLGLHNYWFGLDGHDFRAFWVPLRWTDAALVADPVPFDVALDRVAPDIVLVDRRMGDFFRRAAPPGAPGHDLAVAFAIWMERRDARLVARVEDATYGTMDIYEVKR